MDAFLEYGIAMHRGSRPAKGGAQPARGDMSVLEREPAISAT